MWIIYLMSLGFPIWYFQNTIGHGQLKLQKEMPVKGLPGPSSAKMQSTKWSIRAGDYIPVHWLSTGRTSYQVKRGTNKSQNIKVQYLNLLPCCLVCAFLGSEQSHMHKVLLVCPYSMEGSKNIHSGVSFRFWFFFLQQ